MNEKRLYMDVHVIQTLPPSNINRDDTGSPKTAQYGGIRRARVSSQAWKRAMRNYFNENGKSLGVGVRTKDIVSYVADKILALKPEMDRAAAMEGAEQAINNAGISTKDHIAKALFFLGDKQAEQLAKAVLQGHYSKSDGKALQKILKDNPEIDIALFGRMVADAPELNTDASCQVAHAISTHAVQTEFDYFTALDDLSSEEQTGAEFLDSFEYNSSTLYRYANIAIHDFERQLGDKEATIAACKLFVEAFSNSLPTGKVNSFANQTVPSLVMITLRSDRPINLVSAFEQAVRAKREGGYVNASIERLAEEYKKTSKFVELPLVNIYLKTADQSMGNELGEECENLRELLEKLGKKIGEQLEETGE